MLVRRVTRVEFLDVALVVSVVVSSDVDFLVVAELGRSFVVVTTMHAYAGKQRSQNHNSVHRFLLVL